MSNTIQAVLAQTFKRVLLVCGVTCVVFIATNRIDLISGLLFGATVSFANFFIMGKHITSTARTVLNSGSSKVSKRLIAGYFLRYGILAASFLIVAWSQLFEIFSFIFGIFIVHIAIYWEFFLGRGYADKN